MGESPRFLMCKVLLLMLVQLSGGGGAPRPKHVVKAGPPPRRGGRESLPPFTVMDPARQSAAPAREGESGRLQGKLRLARGGSSSMSSLEARRIDARDGDGEVPAEIATGCSGEQPVPRRLAKRHGGREKLATRGAQLRDGASVGACQIQVFGRRRTTRTSMQRREKIGGEQGSSARRRHRHDETVVPGGCAVGESERGTGIGMDRSRRRSMRESIEKKQCAPAKPKSRQKFSSRAKPKPNCDSAGGTDGNCLTPHLCKRGSGSEGEAGDDVHRADAMETLPKDARGKDGTRRRGRGRKSSADRSLSDRKWARFLRMLMEFKTINGHCDVPEAGGGPNKLLHSWVLRQRQKRKIGTLEAKREEQLKDMGFKFVLRVVCDWDARYREVLEHRMQHGHCLFAKNTTSGKSLAQWVYLQRGRWRGSCRGVADVCEMALKLEACGIAIQKAARWEDYYRRLLLMKLHNGHLRAEMGRDVGMATWMARQRQLFKMFKQGPDKVELLRKAGFEYSIKEQWSNRYMELVSYAEVYGTCKLSRSWQGNPALAGWVHAQRFMKAKGAMSKKRIRLLERIGFAWEINAKHHGGGVWWRKFKQKLRADQGLCKCKATKCIRQYCICFRAGGLCKGCDCVDCHNDGDHEEERADAVEHINAGRQGERRRHAGLPRLVPPPPHVPVTIIQSSSQAPHPRSKEPLGRRGMGWSLRGESREGSKDPLGRRGMGWSLRGESREGSKDPLGRRGMGVSPGTSRQLQVAREEQVQHGPRKRVASHSDSA